MSHLHLASGLELPIDVVTQKLAFLGRTGSGKTYGATKLAELMLERAAQLVAIDPVGVWYGLRVGGDFKLPVFGGLRGDVPLEPTAGAVLADLVVDRGISAVLDVSQFETDAQKARFAEAFASRFFFRKKAAPAAVHLFLEECQEFVPQNPQGGDAQMLHAFTRLAKLGRNFGIGISLISQRPQEVNKKVLNMTECMFAFQMRGPQERKTIKDWSNDKDLDVDIVEELPSLAVGEAFVSSPQWLQVEKRVKIAKKVTADVSSTPKVGAAKATRELTPIDLEQIRTSMAATIEKAKAEDPRELQKEVARLKRELANGTKTAPAPDPARLQEQIRRAVDGAMAAERKAARVALERTRRSLADVLQAFGTRLPTALVNVDNAVTAVKTSLSSAIDGIEAQLIAAPAPAAAPSPAVRHAPLTAAPARPTPAAPTRSTASSNGDLSGVEQRILDTLKGLEDLGIAPADKDTVAALVGYHPNAKSYSNALGASRSAGRVQYPQPGTLGLTDEGRAHAESKLQVSTHAELHQVWYDKLGNVAQRILRPLVQAYPHSRAAAEIAEEAGYHPNAKSFANMKGRLKTLGLISYPAPGMMAATDILFPKGLS